MKLKSQPITNKFKHLRLPYFQNHQYSKEKRTSHLVSKQSHLDVLACDFNMSDVLHVVSGQLEKRKTAGKTIDHVNNPELISFPSVLGW